MSQVIKPKRVYLLHVLILNKNPEIFIKEKEFNQLRQAKLCLDAALALEESYDLLLGNYRELEVEVMSAGVAQMTTMSQEYEDFFVVRATINRRLLNLLSAARMYLHQYPQSIGKIGADRDIIASVCSEKYDSLFEYRFMEALRNYAQHEGLSVHNAVIDLRWLSSSEPKELQFSIKPYALKSSLEGSGFTKHILREMPDKVNLSLAVRVYVGGIGAVHKEVRKLVAPFVEKSRRLFKGAISRHGAGEKKRYSGLTAIAKEDGVVIEKIPIILDWDDIRQKLFERNDTVENLARRFVTSQI